MFTKRQLDGWRGYWALATSGNCCLIIEGVLVGAFYQSKDGESKWAGRPRATEP